MTEEAFRKVILDSWKCEECKKQIKLDHRLCPKHSKELYEAVKED